MTFGAGLETATAVCALGAGLALLVRGTARSTGVLLAGAGLAVVWWVDDLPGAAVPFTLSLLLSGAAPALAAAAGVVWPVRPLTSAERVTVAVSLTGALGLGGLLPAVLFAPSAAGCHDCPANLALLLPAPAVADQAWRAASAAALLWGPAVAVVAARRLWLSRRLERRHTWPMLGGAVGLAVLAAVSAAHELTVPVGEADLLVQRIRLGFSALILLQVAGIAARPLVVRAARRRMARTVTRAAPDVGTTLAQLREMIGDPTLTVAFCSLGGQPVDADGRPAAPSGTAGVVRLERNGAPFADLRHDPLLGGSPDLLRAAVSSGGLALEYLAAQARLRAETRDVVALRRRSVDAGDRERRRLERDLHDGAQQRLIALGVLLAVEDSAAASDRAAIQTELDAALQELRSVARGLFPAALAEGDLPAALRELGDHTPVPLSLEVRLTGPVPPIPGMAVYQLVHDLATVARPGTPLRGKLSGGAPELLLVRVRATAPDGPASARDETDALLSELLHAEDRFLATGGSLTIRRAGSLVTAEGRLPCES